MLSIADSIEVGDVSTYLSANYNSKKGLFGGAIANPTSPVTIAMVTDALRWGSDGGAQTAASLRETANYLIWLCGRFGLEGTLIIGGTGGGTVTPGGIPTTPGRIDFIVSAASYIITGASSATISDFIGYNLDFVRNGIPQSTVITEPSYFTWNRSTGAFTCSPALSEGELIALIPT